MSTRIKEQLVPVSDFCRNHEIELSFISSLQQTGLIEITTIGEAAFIDTIQMRQLEEVVRFFFELEINLEGIETITHLLKRINAMQMEITGLKNRLRLYEPEE
jgi:hypothetical protein